MSKAEFVRLVTADQPAAPAYFGYDADLNRRARPTLDAALATSLRALSLDEALAFAHDGAVLLDVRPAAEFGGGHLAGSVNVGLDGRFAPWAGSVLDPRTAVVIVASPGRAPEAALRLGRVGFDRVVGHLVDLAGALRARPDLLRRVAKTSASDLVRREAAGTAPVVIDVRTAAEWADGHVEGSRNLPLPGLLARLDELPRDREVLVHCQSGFRSSLAASLLARAGFTNVTDLVGGWAAYEAARAPAFPEL
jgi:rhodanese-related sulfurtransferase